MENEFTVVMANHSDKELIAIVTTERGKYQQLAIDAAEKEIASRGISAEQTESLKAQHLDAWQRDFEFETQHVEGTVRFVNMLIDFIVIIVLFFCASVVLAAIGLQVEEESLVPLMMYGFIYLGYYMSMESAWQQTIGKMITRTKVMTMTNDVPTPGDIVARTLCRLIPFDRLSFLFTRNGFHDSISKTTVVRK